MLLACLVGLAANAQTTKYDITPVNTPLRQTTEYLQTIGFTDFTDDAQVENTQYRVRKMSNSETSDECWIAYKKSDTSYGFDYLVYGVAYVFKDKKAMPKDFKKRTVQIYGHNFKYNQWKNRYLISYDSYTERVLQGKKIHKPVGGGIPEQPIRVIVVNK